MGLNVTGLTDYVKVNENELVTRALFSTKSAKMLVPMTGVKFAENVNILDTSVIFQDGGTCGFNASGSTTISNRTLTVGRVSVMDNFCIKDLEKKYTQLLLQEGSYASTESMPEPIYSKLTNLIIGDIGTKIETSIWQGDTASANVNLNKMDGLIKIIGSASGVIDANTTAFQASVVTAITVSSILSIVDGIFQAIPVQLLEKEGVRLVMGMNNYRTYQMALKNANLFNYKPEGNTDVDYIHPGTSLKIVALNGLNGTNKMYVADFSTNVFYGTDLENDFENFKMEYNMIEDVVKFRSNFKFGVQLAVASEIVKFII